jgi:hypothetical protein
MFGTKDHTHSAAERGHDYVTGRAWPAKVQQPESTVFTSCRRESTVGRLGGLLSRHPILLTAGAIGLGYLLILSRERQA